MRRQCMMSRMEIVKDGKRKKVYAKYIETDIIKINCDVFHVDRKEEA